MSRTRELADLDEQLFALKRTVFFLVSFSENAVNGTARSKLSGTLNKIAKAEDITIGESKISAHRVVFSFDINDNLAGITLDLPVRPPPATD